MLSPMRSLKTTLTWSAEHHQTCSSSLVCPQISAAGRAAIMQTPFKPANCAVSVETSATQWVGTGATPCVHVCVCVCTHTDTHPQASAFTNVSASATAREAWVNHNCFIFKGAFYSIPHIQAMHFTCILHPELQSPSQLLQGLEAWLSPFNTLTQTKEEMRRRSSRLQFEKESTQGPCGLPGEVK